MSSPTRYIVKSISRQIKRSRRPMTILFTDIEDSTRYWDRHGDLKGRLMVDRHNRLVFPVIRHFGGRIVKTIGDAVMAAFRDPKNAVLAAIGIQQALEKQRQEDRRFKLRVRIGVHTGKAIVEQQDMFGDAVNVAARVEGQGKGDEILVSGSTATKLKKNEFALTRRGEFTPRGKRRSLTLYRCRWRDYPSVIDNVRFTSFLPLVRRQKIELLFYTAATAGVVYFLFLKYLRYLVADSETLALFILNPRLLLEIHPAAPLAMLALVAAALLVLVNASTVPHGLLRFLKGGFGFALGFALVYYPLQYLDGRWSGEEVLHRSRHLFVEVLADESAIRARPRLAAPVLRTVNKGDLLLLTDVAERDAITWNKVMIGPRRFGWVPRVIPPRIGEPERRVTLAYKFYFRRRDLYALLAGALGFLWGFINFRIRPV